MKSSSAVGSRVRRSRADEVSEIIKHLESMSNPGNVEGMARFGISAKNTLGVSVPNIRKIAREIGRDQALSLALWKTGIHEARLLAGFIGDPESVTESQMQRWADDFDSWDICDQACSNLFDKTTFAIEKAREWSKRKEEFVKRAGFVLMAALAVHDKDADDELFLSFLPIIERESRDQRNFVRKAVNWALRQIGKRNASLNKSAAAAARRIIRIHDKTAKWIASDALRELTGSAVAKKLNRG